jgi:hypothetical protein
VPRSRRTWLVLIRDVSHAAALPGNPALWAALILDPDTGMILGLSVQESEPAAAGAAVAAALSRTARPGRQPPPDLVLCAAGASASLVPALAQVGPGPAPPVHEVQIPAEAEDIFDSAVGHLAGRGQPVDPAMPEDWALLFAQGWAYRRAEPWRRWSDTAALAVTLDLPGVPDPQEYRAGILGRQDIQYGLVLSPGTQAPTGARPDRHRGPGEPGPDDAARVYGRLPAGTLLFYLDPPEEALPAEYRAKAFRYGWPGDADLLPLFAAASGDGVADVGRDDVRRLTLAIAAVIAHDARGLMRADGRGAQTSGGLPLGDGLPGRYRVRTAPPRPLAAQARTGQRRSASRFSARPPRGQQPRDR